MTLRNECWISDFIKEERMNSMRPTVLIIILNYVTYELTLKVIEEIHASLDYDNYAIMVVDNCSPNESAEILEKKSNTFQEEYYGEKIDASSEQILKKVDEMCADTLDVRKRMLEQREKLVASASRAFSQLDDIFE